MKQLVILDFDGTLYRGDSMLDFARFLNAPRYYLSLGALVPLYLLTLIGMSPRSALKSQFISLNFRNKSKKELYHQGNLFFLQFRDRIYPGVSAYLKSLRERPLESELVVVSGSCAEWLTPFMDYLELSLLSAQLAYSPESMCLGKLHGDNISGPAKVRLILNTFDLSSFQEVISFGNARSDHHLKKISTQYHHRYFEKYVKD